MTKRQDYARAVDIFTDDTLAACRRDLDDAGFRCLTVRFASIRSVRGAAVPAKMQAIRAVVQARLDGGSFAEAGVAAAPFLGVRVTRQTASVWFNKYADAVRESNDIFIAATTEER